MSCCTPEYSRSPVRIRRVFALVLLLPVSVFGHWLRVLPSQGGPVRPARPTLERFVAAAVERTHHIVRYDGSYVRIPYPGGDVPPSTGVCTDEVIRAYRAVGIDLQKEVHIDMLNHPSAYPPKWGNSSRASKLASADSNIDHRRVPNLMVFFRRHGDALLLSADASDYHPGDIVTWNLGAGIMHIGMVVDQKSPRSGRYLVVHNIGRGPQMEDVLFNWKIIGHYRYLGEGPGSQ
jgi:uncharacterized protein